MKSLLRFLLVNTAAIYTVAYLLPGVDYSNSWEILLTTAAVLGVVNLVVRPLVKVVTLPINILTLGIFSWLINVLMVYLVTQFVPQFTVEAFSWPAFEWQGFTSPGLHFTAFWSLAITAFCISIITNTIWWVFD